MNVSQSKNPIPPLKPNSLFNKCPSDYMSEISLNKVKQFYSSNKGKKLLCNLIISKDGSKSFSNKTIKPYHELATIINTDCNDLIEKRKENYRKKNELKSKLKVKQIAKEKEELRANIKAELMAELKAELKAKQIAKKKEEQNFFKSAKENPKIKNEKIVKHFTNENPLEKTIETKPSKFLLSQLIQSCDGNNWRTIKKKWYLHHKKMVKDKINFVKEKGLMCDVRLLSNDTVCIFSSGKKIEFERYNTIHYLKEAKRRSLDCGFDINKKIKIYSKIILEKSKQKSQKLAKEKELKKYDKLPNCKDIFSHSYEWNNCRAEKIKIHESKFFGEWKNGERYKGIEWLWRQKEKYDGDKYVGEWKNGKKHGKGTFYKYEMRKDTKNKYNGEKYVGEWKNGQKHGKGTFYKSNGYKYIGNWKNNKMEGLLEYFDGKNDKYVGKWENGKWIKWISKNGKKFNKRLSRPLKFKKNNNNISKPKCSLNVRRVCWLQVQTGNMRPDICYTCNWK